MESLKTAITAVADRQSWLYGWKMFRPMVKKYLVVFLFCLLFFYFYIIYDLTKTRMPSQKQDHSYEATCPPSICNAAPEPKTFWKAPNEYGDVTILIWTKYYGSTDLIDHIRNDSPVPDWCRVTFDKKHLQESGAIVFSMVGGDFTLSDLPARDISQLWVYFLLEPPAYHTREPDEIDGLFNRTMTYRLDSDYPGPYGYVSKRYPPLVTNPYFADPHFPRHKTKLIAWMVSNCVSLSDRNKVMEAMTNAGLEIDVYGGCGTLTCSRDDEIGCYKKLGNRYKFYLAFENSVCRDYITEKFSNALYSGLVPIVYGGGDYESILPPYPKPGFINVKDFESAKDLAEYILHLDKNETAYAEYFEWRQFYNVKIKQGFSGFQKICYDLRKESAPEHKMIQDMHAWWLKEAKCEYVIPW